MRIEDLSRSRIGKGRRFNEPTPSLSQGQLENPVGRIESTPRFTPKIPMKAPEILEYGNRELDNELLSVPLHLICDEGDRIQVAFRIEDGEANKVCSFWFHKGQIRRGTDPRRFMLPRWLIKAKLLEAMEKGIISEGAIFTDCPLRIFE